MADLHPLLRAVLFAVVGWVAIVWACGAGYVAISYAAGTPFMPPRDPARLARAMLRELWLVLWTQPMLLWFQFFGRYMGTGGGNAPVVLIHGYFQNRVDFLYLARRLRAAGAGPLYACNFFWPQRLERSSEHVRAFVARVREQTGSPVVDLVTHSTGGLLALDLAYSNPDWVRRAAFIAIPANGVAWSGPVLGPSGEQLKQGSPYLSQRTATVGSIPVLSVYSAHDNIVHPARTSQLDGDAAVNLEIPDAGHLSVLFDRRVADAVCAHLLEQ